MCVKIEKGNGIIRVFSDYSKEFIDAAHELNGRWRDGAWCFNESVEDVLKETLMDIYGEDGSSTKMVTVKFHAPDFEEESELNIGGIQIAKRFNRDSKVRFTNSSAFLVNGKFKASGGSARYPRIDAEPGTVVKCTIPEAMYERYKDKLELVTNDNDKKKNLLEEKEKLIARLAEIEKELSELC